VKQAGYSGLLLVSKAQANRLTSGSPTNSDFGLLELKSPWRMLFKLQAFRIRSTFSLKAKSCVPRRRSRSNSYFSNIGENPFAVNEKTKQP